MHFLTERESSLVANANAGGLQKLDLDERNASVAQHAAVTQIGNCRGTYRGVGAGAVVNVVIRDPSSPLEPLSVTRTLHRCIC